MVIKLSDELVGSLRQLKVQSLTNCIIDQLSKGFFIYQPLPLQVLIYKFCELQQSLMFLILQPEGNLLRDRYKSLQKRNIIESRVWKR